MKWAAPCHTSFQNLENNHDAPWAPLHRLRVLSLINGNDYYDFHLASTETLGALLPSIFRAAPNLREFRLDASGVVLPSAGREWGFAGDDSARLDGVLRRHPPPRSLRLLELHKVWLEADDLEGFDLPNLRVLTLGACLANDNTARLAAGRLAARYAPGVLKVYY